MAVLYFLGIRSTSYVIRKTPEGSEGKVIKKILYTMYCGKNNMVVEFE